MKLTLSHVSGASLALEFTPKEAGEIAAQAAAALASVLAPRELPPPESGIPYTFDPYEYQRGDVPRESDF